jgi:thioredoxin 1
MKTLATLAIALLALNLTAGEPSLRDTPYNFVKMNIGHGKPHFLELGSDECPGCVIMGQTLYSVSKENPNYNISYVNIIKDRSVAQKFSIQMIPTQIVYDKEGLEVYRHTGTLSKDELSTLFAKYEF